MRSVATTMSASCSPLLPSLSFRHNRRWFLCSLRLLRAAWPPVVVPFEPRGGLWVEGYRCWVCIRGSSSGSGVAASPSGCQSPGKFKERRGGSGWCPSVRPMRVAHELLQAGYSYLDVMTPEEFSAGHASGAVNIPHMYKVGSGMSKNTGFVQEVSARFGKDDEIIVGCQSGGKRSLMAAKNLLAEIRM